ncbi:MAG: flagellar hook capping FlgD N-terminal domain-containing protein [Planctomycetaceae bacterium]|jgi:flagellar basal-body rod modification protein FlgD
METTGFSAATGQAEFLQLFVAQLQNQDPLEPVGQQEFLGQLAQFSTVEGLEKLNAKQSDFNAQFAELLQLQLLNSGTDLLGKTVTYGPEENSGVATEVRQEAGQVLIRVGEMLVPVGDISSVATPPPV